jgi:hypothetical protein
MAGKRTSGMAALGATHILLGALGALACIVGLLGALIVAFAPSFIDVSKLPLHLTTEDLVRTRTPAIGLAVLCAIRVVTSVILIVAGIRVLDVAPAGRRLSLIAAYTWTFTNVFEAFILGEPLVWVLVNTAYPLVTEWLFLRKSWRAAFSGDAVSGEPQEA